MKLGYVLQYVDDVEKTIEFYEVAFDLACNFLHESKQYGEMDTGGTTLGFVQHDTAGSHGFAYEKMQPGKIAAATEIGFVTDDRGQGLRKGCQSGRRAPEQAGTEALGPVGRLRARLQRLSCRTQLPYELRLTR